ETGPKYTIKDTKENQPIYVRESYHYECGIKNDSTDFKYSNHWGHVKGLQFDAHQDFILKSVSTFFYDKLEEGYFDLNINGPSNFRYHWSYDPHSPGDFVVDLNLKIPKGDGYSIIMSHPNFNGYSLS